MTTRPRDPARRRIVGVAVLTAAASVSGCTSPEPAIEVTERDGPFAPLDVVVTGLEPGSEVTLGSSTVVAAVRFDASAEFVVPDDGTVDLGAQAPESGSWEEADPMAFLWSMGPSVWMDPGAWDAPFEVDLVAEDDEGNVLAETVVERPGVAPDVETRAVQDDGVYGQYAVPGDLAPGERRPAVLAFGGSEGRLAGGASVARYLAGLGYPTLAISYFGSPGQPPELENVPVETFLDALAWLHDQAEVDPGAVVTFGVSRGGEMALWVAAENPELVHAAVAPVGAGRLVCGLPDWTEPSWTLEGRPLSDECQPIVSLEERAVAPIAVQDVAGPVLLACGMRDELWPACQYAEDVVERRGDAETVLVRHEDAGHAVAIAPYVPDALGADAFAQFGVRSGADPAATHQVRVELWREVAALLDGLRASP